MLAGVTGRGDSTSDELTEARVPVCSVPGCRQLATVRRASAEPSVWELGELEPFIVVTFLCDEHVGGVDAPPGS
jgi:hypothetical protein